MEVNESFGTNVYTVEVQNMFKTKLDFYERDEEYELGDKVLVTYVTRPIQYWVKYVDVVQLIE